MTTTTTSASQSISERARQAHAEALAHRAAWAEAEEAARRGARARALAHFWRANFPDAPPPPDAAAEVTDGDLRLRGHGSGSGVWVYLPCPGCGASVRSEDAVATLAEVGAALADPTPNYQHRTEECPARPPRTPTATPQPAPDPWGRIAAALETLATVARAWGRETETARAARLAAARTRVRLAQAAWDSWESRVVRSLGGTWSETHRRAHDAAWAELEYAEAQLAALEAMAPSGTGE